MTPIDANITNKIEQDINWSMEIALEDTTKDLLKKLQEKWLLSNDELNAVYETNFKDIVSWSIDDGSELAEKITQLHSIQNKLLATYMANAKEKNEEPGHIKSLLYWTCGIDTDITKNSSAKNITKGIIDEIMSIPEMLIEIVKSPIAFGESMYEALIMNFWETMSAIKDSYTDILGGIDTPESAYKTGRSWVLIILTFFPGAIGKTLLNIWRTTGKLAAKIGKGASNAAKSWLKKAFPKSAESLAKKASKKTIDLNKNMHTSREAAAIRRQAIINQWKQKLSGLKKGIIESKPAHIVGKGIEAGKVWVAKVWKWLNYMKNLPLVNDILNIPVRLAKGTTKLLWRIIPKRLQPRLIKDVVSVIKNKQALTKYLDDVWGFGKANAQRLQDLNKSITLARKNLGMNLRNTLIWLSAIGTAEIHDITEELTKESFLDELAMHLHEDNDVFLPIEDKLALWLETGSTEISSDALDYPELEWFDWSSIDRSSDERPVITVTGLASKSGSLDINDRISRQRAQEAKSILADKYGIPEEAFVLENSIQSADDNEELSDWQGVHVNIDNLYIESPTYVAGYDDIQERHNPAPTQIDRLDQLNPVFLAKSEEVIRDYIQEVSDDEIDDYQRDSRREVFSDDTQDDLDGGIYKERVASMEAQWSDVINTGIDSSSTYQQQERLASLQEWLIDDYLV